MKKIIANWNPSSDNKKDLFIKWINHHQQAGFDISILVEPTNLSSFYEYYPEGRYLVVHEKNRGCLELNTTDFLFEWYIDERDQFVLLKPSVTNWKTGIIGRVFQVHVHDQDPNTTFEIPDFVQYRHENHSAFLKHGISVDNISTEPSNRWVCFSLIPSQKQYSFQYYYNNFLTVDEKYAIGERVYKFYHMNVIVQKEKKYGIIWHPKCGCTTIMKTFCSVNNISIKEHQKLRSLNYSHEKFRDNMYLEGIDYIHFVRNPYYRFLSTFIDKHVLQRDDIFIHLDGLVKFNEIFKKSNLLDLCLFLKEGKYISEHYTPQSKIAISPQIKTLKIDDNTGLNHYLTVFLKKYHPKMNLFSSLGCFENSIKSYSLEKKTEKEPQLSLKYFSREEWLEYMENYNLNYDSILDERLKKAIYSLYKEDFIAFGYNPNIPDKDLP